MGWDEIVAFYGGPFPIIGETQGGQPILDPKWSQANIVHMDFAGYPINCHRKIADDVAEIAFFIRFNKLQGEIHRIDSWCVRLSRRGMKLSTHAFGAAFDLNPAENPMGSHICKIHPEIIAEFKRHGAIHGAGWHCPDPMHFQFCGGY